jgi:hypothetical protein
MIPPPSQNTVGISNQITLLIFNVLVLLTPININDVSKQTSDIFYLIDSFMLISFSLRYSFFTVTIHS